MNSAGISTPLSDAERTLLVSTRRDLHAHPELAYEETRTAAVVLERLRAAGLDPQAGVAGTGVVVSVGEPGSKTVLLRADMDALPLTEENEKIAYRSTAPGRMHACGHDGHTAALISVAERLAAAPPKGRVVCCFQPAEEGRGGAQKMIDEGILEGVDAVFGVHLWNSLPVGRIGLATGPIMAAVDSFEITLIGQGGHGAMPQQTRDPLVAACHVVTALQTIVSRSTSPLDSCVVTVGKLEAGDSFNIIPHTARLSGTCRAFSKESHDALPDRVREIVTGVANALGCEATIDYRRICSPTVNEPLMTELMREVAREQLGTEAVVTEGEGARTMAGEDFSALLERVPGCFALVGSRNPARGLVHPHHSPHFDFDEEALEVSVRLLEGVARRYLEGQ